MNFINKVVENLKGKESKKTIVLPESNDIRILEAAEKIVKMDFANIILIGNKEEIKKVKEDFSFDLVNIIDPLTSDKYNELVNILWELRKEKGMTKEQAQELLKDNVYFGMMLLKSGSADGLVSGACHSTADTLRPALQIIKTCPNTKLVSSFFLMELSNSNYGQDGMLLFSDCGLVENPDAEQLSEIALASATSWGQLMKTEPKIAMLSYSTKGSASGELVDKVVKATNLVQTKAPQLIVDGELQVDAAIVENVARSKAPNSPVKGQANILIFPDLQAGNIGYKLVQRLANANAYGPITQGLALPVNDLSRGCNVDDIVGVVAITCIQAYKGGQ